MGPGRGLSLTLLIVACLVAPGDAQPPTPRLIGVMITEDGRGQAYLEDVQTGRVRAYQVGEAVGDGHIVAIESDRVVLERDGSRIDIRFSHVSGGPGAPAPPPGAAQGLPAPPLPAESGPSPSP